MAAARTRSKSRPRREDIAAGDCLCDHCSGKCCRYFSLPIETPESWDDYDSIRWYLAHGRTLVYVEDATWYLVVMTRCKYLTADDRCAIYWSRPKICREYTTDECEYDSDWSFEKVFETPEQLWEYAEAVLPPRRRPKAPQGPTFVQIGGLNGQAKPKD
ncbi:MAG TPA: YkgJ family cysteine cluster protein [Isosphaeraceae bacterium]|nr:YkgJ family cysteine cluster protein [Isosphaeraceae bacterium]